VLVCLGLVQAGLGISAFIGIGGDPVIGTHTREAVEMLDRFEATDAVVIVGEIGGGMEEVAAEYVAGMSKPVAASGRNRRGGAEPARIALLSVRTFRIARSLAQPHLICDIESETVRAARRFPQWYGVGDHRYAIRGA
jgi:hypothetical protein